MLTIGSMHSRALVLALGLAAVAACGGATASLDDLHRADVPSTDDADAPDASSDVDADTGCRIVVPGTAKQKGPFVVCD